MATPAQMRELAQATQVAITNARRKLLRQNQAVKDTEQLILALEEMLNRQTAK